LKAAVGELDNGKAVLRARAEARLAGLLFEEGRFEEAMEYGTRVLDTAPAMFRHLDISLPVRVETDNESVSKEIADAITDSPRFHADNRGYPIKIRKTGDNLTATLLSPQQALLAEVSVPATKRKPVEPEPADAEKDEQEDKDDEQEEILDPQDELVALFHKKAFAPRIDLSQGEINSLDGSTLTDSRRNNNAREAIGLPTLRPGDRPELP
jgi:hypothetical protein